MNDRALFHAVAGHRDAMFYGADTADGRRTLWKTTTTWEVMHYLAMSLGREAVEEATLDARHGATAPSPMDREELRTYCHAMGHLAGFMPELSAVRLPSHWAPHTPALAEALGGVDGVRAIWERERGWLLWGDRRWAGVWPPLLTELFLGAVRLESASDYEDQRWGVGLVDLTSRFAQAAVMDVKVGFLRYNRVTPPDKVEKINRKDEGSILRAAALRVSGLRRYIHPAPQHLTGAAVGAEAGEEHQGKAFGFAVSDVDGLAGQVRGFFSTQGRLAVVEPWRPKDVRLLDRSHVVESGAERRRQEKALAAARGLLHLFEDTEEGRYLLHSFAFVATSLLCVYDAQDETGDTCTVRLIDLALSSTRRLNYAESAVGFLAGLRNFERCLSPLA